MLECKCARACICECMRVGMCERHILSVECVRGTHSWSLGVERISSKSVSFHDRRFRDREAI